MATSESSPPLQLRGARRANIAYSVHGLKSIGYVQLSYYPPPPLPAAKKRAATAAPAATAGAANRPYIAVALAVLVLVAAYTLPLVTSKLA